MQITPEDLRHRYASLSDESLLEVEESDLMELGRKYYEAELAHRNLRRVGAPESAAAHEFDADAENAVEIGPDWIENAACPASFTAVPGSAHAPEAEHACDVLIAAGIPYQLSLVPHDPTGNDPDRGNFDVYQVLVPQSLNLKAVSVLDVEIFGSGANRPDQGMMAECNLSVRSKHCSRDGISTDRSSSCVSAGTRVSN
jgi:hypothetical protein